MILPPRMTNHQPSADNDSQSQPSTARALVESALDQFAEATRPYNDAVDSYNTHLENHRDHRDLHDIPSRVSITEHDHYEDAVEGDPVAIEALLDDLIDEASLDSELRRHPRTFPIHIEACEQLELARRELVTTLENALYHDRTAETSR